MEDYECWHLEAVGAYSHDWIQQQDDYPGSDAEDTADKFESNGDKEKVLREELDEESEPDDLDDLQTCRYFAEKELEQRGLADFDKVRHIDTWEESTLRAYAKTGEISLLPTVHSSISDLSGKPLLVFATVADSKERLTMSDDEKMASWFAVGATVIGEAKSSTELRPAVMVMTAVGPNLPPVQSIEFAVQDLHSTLQSGVTQMRKENASGMKAKPVGIFVASKSVVVKYQGLNLNGISYKTWLGIRQSEEAVRGQNEPSQFGDNQSASSYGQNEDEFAKALALMKKNDGRDFLEESVIAENARNEAERRVLKEAEASRRANTMSSSNASQLYGSDMRGDLPSEDKLLHRQRCTIFTCGGILEQGDAECCECECPKSELCVCGDCGQPYNPNRHKKCNTTGCGRLFPHHPHYYKFMQRPATKSSAETEKDAEKLTLEKLKKKIECIRFRRVLLDARGDPSIRLCTETQPIEVVDILCRVSTTAAEDITFNQPPIEDYTAAMSYDMIVKTSKALYGKVSKGRLSMWQFLPMEGAWSASWYCSNHVSDF